MTEQPPVEQTPTETAQPAPPAPVATQTEVAREQQIEAEEQQDTFPHERTVTVAPVAPSGWTGRFYSGSGLELAAPAPTPHPNDSDLTKWSREEEIGGEGGESAASDAEAYGDQDYTVGELVDYLETVTDSARLDELQSAEQAREGGARPTALRAIQDRREELANPA